MAEYRHKGDLNKNCNRCRCRRKVERENGTRWGVCMECYMQTGSTEYHNAPYCPRCQLVWTVDGSLCDACKSETSARLREARKVVYT